MKAARNIAIIALLALFVAAVPGGGNVADGLLALLQLVFMALIGVAAWSIYRQNRLAFDALDERQHNTLLIALGAIVVMIAGADELLGTGPGTLVFIGVLGLSGFAIFSVIAQSRSY